MALLNPGYWQTTYWPDRYWEPLYWPEYGYVQQEVADFYRYLIYICAAQFPAILYGSVWSGELFKKSSMPENLSDQSDTKGDYLYDFF